MNQGMGRGGGGAGAQQPWGGPQGPQGGYMGGPQGYQAPGGPQGGPQQGWGQPNQQAGPYGQQAVQPQAAAQPYGAQGYAAVQQQPGGVMGAQPGVQQAQPAAAQPVATDTTGKPLPAGWSTAVDPASGRTYYINNHALTSQWEVPTAPAQPAGR